MTIEEAIAHAQETADTRSDLCDECRDEHRQLADWLTELKQLREETSKLKRLLKLALNDFEFIYDEHSCTGACECDTCCPYNMEKNRCLGKWKHTEETLKLIGDDK